MKQKKEKERRLKIADDPTPEEREFHTHEKEKGCCVPGCTNQADDFHHIYVKGVYGTLAKPGAKKHHKLGVGICRFHHMEFHHKLGTVKKFEKLYHINLDDEAYKNRKEYWMKIKITICRAADCDNGRFFNDNHKAFLVEMPHHNEACLKKAYNQLLRDNQDCDTILKYEIMH